MITSTAGRGGSQNTACLNPHVHTQIICRELTGRLGGSALVTNDRWQRRVIKHSLPELTFKHVFLGPARDPNRAKPTMTE